MPVLWSVCDNSPPLTPGSTVGRAGAGSSRPRPPLQMQWVVSLPSTPPPSSTCRDDQSDYTCTACRMFRHVHPQDFPSRHYLMLVGIPYVLAAPRTSHTMCCCGAHHPTDATYPKMMQLTAFAYLSPHSEPLGEECAGNPTHRGLLQRRQAA
jgi:hypothetical protein